MIKKREASIISAYTGILLGTFSDMHSYIEEVMQRPVYTHEMGNRKIADEIKRLSKEDFLNLNVEK